MTTIDKDSNVPLRSAWSAHIARRLSAGNPFYALSALGLFALIWFLLTGDDWKSWLVGLPAVIVAAWCAVRLQGLDRERISLSGLMRFLPFFIWESVLGGIDVASRVMRPKMHIAPGFLDYRMRLTQLSARRLFVNCLSLLPGTLAADLDGEYLRIHALDRGIDLNDELLRLERMVSAVYGESL
ncbi:MAG: Na+/H+ antiporter subunit E [Candidatus Thiodiazotropha endolucinida]|uniref:Na+/H+ antiporter subunit E n=1 Tax=Candidatus Thiodiazotropha taylori TaxID=2792791 RepID=A0A9E4NNQ9_9GAMM|nr:Na+/H+ antiporter subunit E [Candidatus Thiodiazotropha taylori]MCW4238026.1 Na+/H+ antiporter subunit E [Candidatus Thiodiazotropha endolucinida]